MYPISDADRLDRIPSIVLQFFTSIGSNSSYSAKDIYNILYGVQVLRPSGEKKKELIGFGSEGVLLTINLVD